MPPETDAERLFFLLPHDTWRIQVDENFSNVFRQSKQFGKEKKERRSPKCGS